MDDAWQSQDMGPTNSGGAINIPQDVTMAPNGGGPAGDDSNWVPSGGRSPGPADGGIPRRPSRSRSPNAREGGGRGDRGDRDRSDRDRGDRDRGGRDRGRDRDDRDRGRRDPGGANPGNNLHVSGLTTSVDSEMLEAVFIKVGRVQKAAVMYDPHSKESRGFGFVTMETPEEAEAAINALNATEQFGKVMNVEKARRARARTPTPGKYYGPPKRGRDYERPYDPRERPYYRDSRDDRRGGGRYDDYPRGGGGGGGRYDDRDRHYGRGDRDRDRDYDRGYDRRYDDRRY